MSKPKAISVQGHGEASARPDTIEVRVMISALETSIAAANNVTADAAARVIETLRSAGVDHGDIGTSSLSIGPEYTHVNQQRQLAGYRASNSIIVRIRDIDTSGGVIDDMVTAGGDFLIVNGLEFVIEDPTPIQSQAREAAWNDAVAKATQLAQLSGRDLGSARSIREAGPGHAPQPRMAMESLRSAEQPIEPGSRSVAVDIEVEFDLH